MNKHAYITLVLTVFCAVLVSCQVLCFTQDLIAANSNNLPLCMTYIRSYFGVPLNDRKVEIDILTLHSKVTHLENTARNNIRSITHIMKDAVLYSTGILTNMTIITSMLSGQGHKKVIESTKNS